MRTLVVRGAFYSYRRNRPTEAAAGTRSLAFLSVLRAQRRLSITLPLPLKTLRHLPFAAGTTGKGHHGIENARCTLEGDENLQSLVDAIHPWLVAE